MLKVSDMHLHLHLHLHLCLHLNMYNIQLKNRIMQKNCYQFYSQPSTLILCVCNTLSVSQGFTKKITVSSSTMHLPVLLFSMSNKKYKLYQKKSMFPTPAVTCYFTMIPSLVLRRRTKYCIFKLICSMKHAFA